MFAPVYPARTLGIAAAAVLLCLPGLAAAGIARHAATACPAWVPAAAADAPLTVRSELTLVGTTSARIEGVIGGAAAKATVEYSLQGTTTCAPVQKVTGGRIDLTLPGLQPATRYTFRVAVDGPSSVKLGSGGSFITLPRGVVAEGVTVGSTPIGRYHSAALQAALEGPLATPLRMTYKGAIWHVAPRALGARLSVSRAVAAALAAPPGTRLPPLSISVDRARVNTYVAGLGRRWNRAASQASVKLVGTHAVVTPRQPGVVVDSARMSKQIETALLTGNRRLLPLAVRTMAAVTGKPVRAVVVRLGSQTLTAYLNGKPVLKTPVTTGRPALPTPIGSFKVEFRSSPYVFHSPWPKGNAYYYPPTPVTWAMEFYDGDFLHDDPAEPSDAFGSDSQDGYFASHGCVHVPHDVMAFLYNWLPVGAPVIVAQN